MSFPGGAFIDGGFRPAISGKTFQTVNPATGEKLADVAACGTEDVDFAVEKAREAFDDGRWSKAHPAERQGGAHPAVQACHTQRTRACGHGKPGFRKNRSTTA